MVNGLGRRPGLGRPELVGSAHKVSDIRFTQVARAATLEVTVVKRQQGFLVERIAREVAGRGKQTRCSQHEQLLGACDPLISLDVAVEVQIDLGPLSYRIHRHPDLAKLLGAARSFQKASYVVW